MIEPRLNAHSASQDIAPLSIAYETEHCRVRELDADDACETIGAWMADPAIASSLNAPARALSLDDIRRYITSHDRVTGHLLGVFRKTDSALIGLWSVYVDWQHREFMVNVLIPGRIEGELGALKETGRPLYDIFFDDLGLDAMRYNVLASNRFMQDRRNVPGTPPATQPEHRSATQSASGNAQEVIEHYRITREQRAGLWAGRAARDAAWAAARKARREGGA